MKRWTFISVYLLLSIACASAERNESLISIFEGSSARTGDKVTGMRITEIERLGKDPEESGLLIRFSGRAVISGSYSHEDGDEFFDASIFFFPDETSLSSIPKLQDDERMVWFAFANYKDAAREFGPVGSGGTAVIIIDDYLIDSRRTEVVNTATLVSVLRDTLSSPKDR